MKKSNIIVYILICIIIIVGVFVWYTKGFNLELQYSARKQIQIDNKTGIEKADIQAISDEVLGNTRHIVQKVEIFGNSISIVSEELTEEQRNQIIEKFNEKYSDELKSEDIKITDISFTRVKDIVKKFLMPGVITLSIILIYFIIKYRKLKILKVILQTILTPVVTELLFFSLIAILRIPFGRVTVSIGVCLYLIAITILTIIYQNKLKQLKNEEEKE